ncbi:MAG: hypothetical protein WB809_04310 [Thermoplasmata archaeon]
MIEIVGLSEVLAPLFPSRAYCSGRCVRADFLEKRELLDSIIESPAKSLITDLEITYTEFDRVFGALQDEALIEAFA